MKHASLLIAFLFLCGSVIGCGESSDGGTDSGGGGSSGAATGGTGGATGGTAGSTSGTGGSNACGANVVANAVNNYSFSSTLSFPPVMVQPDREITFDWSAVTTDFIGHSLDPVTGIDTVNAMLWKLTQE